MEDEQSLVAHLQKKMKELQVSQSDPELVCLADLHPWCLLLQECVSIP